MTLFDILIICGISFVIKEVSGPWGVLGRIRNALMTSGPSFSRIFFFGLLNCWFCCGYWSGVFKIALSSHHLSITSFLEWGFVGAAISLLFGGIYERLYRE